MKLSKEMNHFWPFTSGAVPQFRSLDDEDCDFKCHCQRGAAFLRRSLTGSRVIVLSLSAEKCMAMALGAERGPTVNMMLTIFAFQKKKGKKKKITETELLELHYIP